MQTYRMLRQMMRIITNVNCALLGYYAATTGDFLPTFPVNLSVQSIGVKNKQKQLSQYVVYIGRSVGGETSYWDNLLSFGFLTPEEVTDMLSRNVGTKLPLLAA